MNDLTESKWREIAINLYHLMTPEQRKAVDERIRIIIISPESA